MLEAYKDFEEIAHCGGKVRFNIACDPACLPRFLPSPLRLFEIVDEVVDSVSGGSQLTDNLAIVWIVLALECASRFVDVPQTLRDLPTLDLGHPKNAVDGLDIRIVKVSESWLTIPMPFRAGVGHVPE